MLKLSGKTIAVKNLIDAQEPGTLFKIFGSDDEETTGLNQRAYIVDPSLAIPSGYGAYLVLQKHLGLLQSLPASAPIVVIGDEFEYLRAGDVIRVSAAEQRIRTLYRRESRQNHFLVTERCDNYCLMCSQPPKDVNDDWVIQEILDVLPLIDPEISELGFTGGEPTLLGQRFIDVLLACKTTLPSAGIHVLSNGRKFSDWKFAEAWAEIEHPDLMVGIPVYADVSNVHDYVVQADGAFDQTIRGILNLKRLEQRVEIRVVLHQQTVPHLARLAEFISRNLLFVDHVALMGLEITGFTRANLGSLWIDPLDYQKQLSQAVRILDACGLRVSIYNLPLCLLDRGLWPFAVQSISDWKNEYLPQCSDCDVKDRCAGFFWSARFKQSENIRPITNVLTHSELT
jgi:His-Xaa-Ser system radical SAM maturase HxsC